MITPGSIPLATSRAGSEAHTTRTGREPIDLSDRQQPAETPEPKLAGLLERSATPTLRTRGAGTSSLRPAPGQSEGVCAVSLPPRARVRLATAPPRQGRKS